MEEVRAAFRPEFLNRLDEILLFHRLFREHMAGIVDIQVARLAKRLEDRGIALEMDKAARAWLGERGYDPVYGARPLKRVIQRQLENPLAMMVLDGRIGDGDTARVSAGEGGLIVNGEALEQAAA
jgi:ATP-dependent Clp protease ATP-binding subunit ClpB